MLNLLKTMREISCSFLKLFSATMCLQLVIPPQKTFRFYDIRQLLWHPLRLILCMKPLIFSSLSLDVEATNFLQKYFPLLGFDVDQIILFFLFHASNTERLLLFESTAAYV